ncbi:MAG: OFA family MFS transporter [Acidimicrobiales bacterium]
MALDTAPGLETPSSRIGGTLDSAESWRNVAAGFLAMFTVFGVAYSFGAFFRPMARDFGAGRSAAAAVFSITACVYFLGGSVSGWAVDRIGPRRVLCAGAVFLAVGLLATSRVHVLWAGYLTYGLGVGLAVACSYVPMVAVVGGWFVRHRGSALGIAVAGIGLGTLAGAPLAAAVIDHVGWRQTYVVFGVAGAVLLLVAAALSSTPPLHVGGRPRLGAAVRTRQFACLYASGLFASLALFQVFVYLTPYAEDNHVGKVAAAALVGIVGGASIIGRIGLGFVADRVGRIRTYQACFLTMALAYGIWLASHSFGALVVFAVVMGVGYGGFIALSPAVLAELFGTAGMGGVVGLVYTASAFGALIGPIVAGTIIDHAGYAPAIALSMAMATTAFVVLLPLKARHP